MKKESNDEQANTDYNEPGAPVVSGVALAERRPRRPPRQTNHPCSFVAVKYHPIDDLQNLLRQMVPDNELKVDMDEHSNQLILQGGSETLNHVLKVIEALDVPQAATPQGQYLTCRICMLELPAKDQNLKPFSLLLERPSQSPPSRCWMPPRRRTCKSPRCFRTLGRRTSGTSSSKGEPRRTTPSSRFWPRFRTRMSSN